MSYQDLYRHGTIIEQGERDCLSRWHALPRTLPISPATVVDLGAAEGYFSVRWAERNLYDTVVALDPSPALLDTARAHPELHLIVCQKQLSVEDLWEFGRCEHADLTLCLNVLHHFGPQWARALEAVLTWGDRIIIETPDPHDAGACWHEMLPELHRACVALPWEGLGRPVSHTSSSRRWLGQIATPKSSLTAPYWHAPSGVQRPGSVHLFSKGGMKFGAWPRKGERRAWIPGINLATYLALDGVWPTRDSLAECITRTVAARTAPHGDIRPWNWIVTGDPATPIQLIDEGDFTSDDAAGLALTLEALGR